ncbi:hypothetical protein [Prescottella equi]|uniref:hypothetical protein n=1 Tax=Rhodococcus hoagii TaxID=43767 RepID=UPI00384CA385
MEDSLVTRAAWTRPAHRIGRDGCFHPIELVVDRGSLHDGHGRELRRGRECTLPLTCDLAAAAGRVIT